MQIAEFHTAEESLASIKSSMDPSRAKQHLFLLRFETGRLERDQLIRFALAWYHTARRHKEAFPVVVWNTLDDDVRFDLIEILREEYGNGNRENIHARMLLRFLRALGIGDSDIRNAVLPAEIERFGREVLRIWKDSPPARAFGLHFALEYLAAALHKHFAVGLEKYEFLKTADREYFDYHRVAEEQHADHSEAGYLYYAADPQQRDLLDSGVRDGMSLLESLWDAFNVYVFGTDDGTKISN